MCVFLFLLLNAAQWQYAFGLGDISMLKRTTWS